MVSNCFVELVNATDKRDIFHRSIGRCGWKNFFYLIVCVGVLSIEIFGAFQTCLMLSVI